MTDKWHWLRHKWGMWTQYEEKYGFRYHTGQVVHGYRTEIRQRRKCLVCGKLQDKQVAYDGRLVSNEDYNRRAIQLQREYTEAQKPELFDKDFWQDFNQRVAKPMKSQNKQ